jgi:hypothetical protein
MVLNNLISAYTTIRTCASKLELDTCYLSTTVTENDVQKKIKYYGECDSGEICTEIGDAYKCVSRKYLLKLNKDCIANEECQSNLCKDKKCSELSVGDACSSDNQCGKGLYCKGEVCTEYAAEGEACNDGIECLPYLVCGGDKCVKKFSLENGQKTKSDYACQSGVIEYVGSSYICTEITVQDECSTKNKCKLEYTYEGQKYENTNYGCTSTADGKSICEYKFGTPEMDEYISQYKEKFEELDKEDLEEIENYDTLDSKDILEAYVKYINYPKVKNAEKCVLNYYLSEASESSQRMISLKKILLIGLIALLI